jgi:alpha-L-fucosidase
MNQFEEGNPEQLKEFLIRLNELVEEFHPNIYLNDGVFSGLEMITNSVNHQIDFEEQK